MITNQHNQPLTAGLSIIAEAQLQNSPVVVGDTISAPATGMTARVDRIYYLDTHNCVCVEAGGQRISLAQLRKMIDAGQIRVTKA